MNIRLKNRKLLSGWLLFGITVCLLRADIFWGTSDFARDVSILSKLSPRTKTALRQKLSPRPNEISDKALVTGHPELLSQLSAQQMKVLESLYLLGKTPKETAYDLQITQPAVSHHKAAGLERLRGLVAPDMALVTGDQKLLNQL